MSQPWKAKTMSLLGSLINSKWTETLQKSMARNETRK
jgi:hypothetical protein